MVDGVVGLHGRHASRKAAQILAYVVIVRVTLQLHLVMVLTV